MISRSSACNRKESELSTRQNVYPAPLQRLTRLAHARLDRTGSHCMQTTSQKRYHRVSQSVQPVKQHVTTSSSAFNPVAGTRTGATNAVGLHYHARLQTAAALEGACTSRL